MTADTSTEVAILLLEGVRFVRLGDSRVGRMLSSLLISQGARQMGSTAGNAGDALGIDILIDDRTSGAGVQAELESRRTQDPRLVCLRFTDFPRSHPRWSDRNMLHDEMIHAELGLNRMGGGAPKAEPLAIASAYGAIWGAVYVAAALKRQDQTGAGDYIELPLFSAALTVLARRLLSLSDKSLLDPLSLPHLPLQEIFECADGRFVQSQGNAARFVHALCEATGHPEWRDEAVAGLHLLPDRAAVDEWNRRFSDALRQRPAMEWETAINALSGACTVCRTHAEWLATEHAHESRIISKAGIGLTADTGVVGAGVRTFAADQDVRAQESVFRGAKPAPAEAGAARQGAEGFPLAGLRVIDFAVILAGPTCGRTLAELGAEVIKIDIAERPSSMYGWLDVNRGKRSILIDLRRPAGLDIARRLVATADVLVENHRAGKLAKLGLGFEDAVRLRPNIVYASLNAFDFGGPWMERAGWEHNAQAATGMQVARAEGGVPKMVPVPVNDYSTGLLGAYGVLLGLRQAQATGRAVRVTGSLARSASFIQSGELMAASTGIESADQAATLVFQCSDGWVRALVENSGVAAKIGALTGAIQKLNCDAAISMLRSNGIRTVTERTVADLQAGKVLDEEGLQVIWQHPNWGWMKQITARPAVSDISFCTGWPAPDPGSDGEAILAEIGYSAQEIAALKSTGIVHERIPLFLKS